MEKSPTQPPPPSTEASRPLSPPEWEALFDDFQFGGGRRERWTSSALYNGLSLLDLSLSAVLRRDFPLSVKLHILVFLEQFFEAEQGAEEQTLARIADAVRTLMQATIDGSSVTFVLKEQMLISATSIFISLAVADHREPNQSSIQTQNKIRRDCVKQLESLTESLLTVVNRPSHGPDRQLRSAACECLRELERAWPCLLVEIAGQLWGLCQSERTHVAQNYVLLLATAVYSIVLWKPPNVSILNASLPLVPFNVPQFLIADGDDGHGVGGGLSREISSSSHKTLRRVISFLLESPQFLNPCAMMELMSMILPVAVALDLQASLLKVQFSGLLYTFDPLLCHSFLMMHTHFIDAFNGQEIQILRRLVAISKESQHSLVFRLLALHWLLGFVSLMPDRESGKKKVIPYLALNFYPTVYDPLALKSLKLDLLAYCSILLDDSTSSTNAEVIIDEAYLGLSAVKLFEDGLVSVSAFKWLQPWSTETAVAFRTLHKFLIGSSCHSDADPSSTRTLMESTIFRTLQKTLVDLAVQFKCLVPVIVGLINRLLACKKHLWLGERLLQTFDEHLLLKVTIGYQLPCYFPIFHQIAENDTVPPFRLIECLARFMIFLIEKHGPDTELKSWSQGSKVLNICRTMLTHHHGSRLFLGLSRLLAFTCMYFPDLEVRDNARIYLRMLICIPGKKLRRVLNSGDQVPGITPSPQLGTYFTAESPRPARDLKKSRTISSYIHLSRKVPLLVKQSWSLSLPTLGIGGKNSFLQAIRDSVPSVEQSDQDGNSMQALTEEVERIDYPNEPLRVMDSKISRIIEILRRHFSCIPDFRHMPGFKVRICCSLRFESEPFNRIWGVNIPSNGLDQSDMLPAMYATVLTFSSSAPYGSIPSYHIPLILGEPLGKDESLSQRNSLEIVPIGKNCEDNSFKHTVTVELEPHEPVPGLVDVSIEANTENGQIIHGQLQSVTVGIEDFFLRATIPPDTSEDLVPGYYLDLFDALWEACGSSTNTGREAFLLKGGKGIAAINGTQSVKLLEVPAAFMIEAVESHLSHFVVGVTGEHLINLVKNGGIIRDVIWKDVDSDSALNDAVSQTNSSRGPLFLKSIEDEGDPEDKDENISNSYPYTSRKNMGCFLVLIFLPPRFHLLFQMEVCDVSTLVRIRTDHWPCLAYIDDYLEALFSE